MAAATPALLPSGTFLIASAGNLPSEVKLSPSVKAQMQRVTTAKEASFVFRVKADRRFARGWHCHPELELTYIVESQGTRLVGDSIESYESGDLVLLGPNLPHAWRSEDSHRDGFRRDRQAPKRTRGATLHRAIVIQFRADFLGQRLLEAPELASVRSLLESSSRGIRIVGRTRDEVARRLLAMRSLQGADRLIELLRVLAFIAKNRKEALKISRSPLTAQSDAGQVRRIDRVLAFVEERHTEAVAQVDAARLLGMSPAGFSRFFRRATGRTFVAYLTELRLSRAARLLIETDFPVLEIAMRSGFHNLSNFNRRFRALRGATPSAFRASHAEAARG